MFHGGRSVGIVRSRTQTTEFSLASFSIMIQMNEAEFELLISTIWARQKWADSRETLSADVSATNSPYHVSSLHTLQAEPNE
jgi:hypothetical protein